MAPIPVAVSNSVAKIFRHSKKRVVRGSQIATAPLRGAGRLMALARNYHRPVITQHCPACSSRRVTLVDVIPASGHVSPLGTVFVSGCVRCGLLFVNPMPTEDSLNAVYSPDGRWARGREDKPEVIDPSSRSLTYLSHLLEPVRDVIDVLNPQPGAIALDVGCGDGRTLDGLGAHGWMTWGIDPADKRGFPRHRELAALPDSPTCDLLILHHVIEHVGAPLQLLRDACRALKQDGIALVSVPSLDNLPEHLDLKYCISPSSHIVSYSRDCLCTLMEMAGFEPRDATPDATRRATRRDLKRLRMIGVKREHSPIEIRRPLGAARSALARFHEASGDGWRFKVMPPRVRGMALHLQRRATRSQPKGA